MVVQTPFKTAEERAAFEISVQEWIKPRVAKHKYLRGGVVVIDSIPKRYALLTLVGVFADPDF